MLSAARFVSRFVESQSAHRSFSTLLKNVSFILNKFIKQLICALIVYQIRKSNHLSSGPILGNLEFFDVVKCVIEFHNDITMLPALGSVLIRLLNDMLVHTFQALNQNFKSKWFECVF